LDTVGRPTKRSLSPAPTIEEIMPESAQQADGVGEPRASTEERKPEPFATTGAVEPVMDHVLRRGTCERRAC
jgi:hypothetical protein